MSKAIEATCEGRLLVQRGAAEEVRRPGRDRLIVAGQVLVVVASRRGLGQILAATERRQTRSAPVEPAP